MYFTTIYLCGFESQHSLIDSDWRKKRTVTDCAESLRRKRASVSACWFSWNENRWCHSIFISVMTTQILSPTKQSRQWRADFLTRFWAVRWCDALESPVILTYWNDCSYFFGSHTNTSGWRWWQRGMAIVVLTMPFNLFHLKINHWRFTKND